MELEEGRKFQTRELVECQLNTDNSEGYVDFMKSSWDNTLKKKRWLRTDLQRTLTEAESRRVSPKGDSESRIRKEPKALRRPCMRY